MKPKKETEGLTTAQLIQAYDRLMGVAKQSLEQAKQEGEPIIQSVIDAAKEKMINLGEMSRQEATEIGNYIMRDLHDVADYLNKQQQKLPEWLSRDLVKVEKQTVNKISPLIERAALELKHLAKTAAKVSDWHTGEIRGIGTLKCDNCGQLMHFDKTSRIPPCPKCHKTLFKRIA